MLHAQKKRRRSRIDINLLLKDGFDQSFYGQFLSWVLTYGRYIIIITQIIVLSVFFLRFKLDRDHTDLKESVSQKQAIVESVADLEKEIRRVQRKLTNIGIITSSQEAIVNLLRFLENNTPSDTTFANIFISADNINFSAKTRDLRSFNFFLFKLQQEERFSQITLEDILRREDGKIEFKINAKVDLEKFS